MTPIPRTTWSVEGTIAVVTLRFWWPVHAAFRDHGHSVEDSLRLCEEAVAENPENITRGLRHPSSGGRLRCWMAERTRELLGRGRPCGSGSGTFRIGPSDAAAREPLRVATLAQQENGIPLFHRRWAHVALEDAIERLRLSCAERAGEMEFDDLVGYLDRPLPKDAVEDFTGWIQIPQIRSFKKQFWNNLRQVINETITDPRLLERELVDLFPTG